MNQDGPDAVDWTRVRLAIFDVYGTLLRVVPKSQAEASAHFAVLWREVFGELAPMDWPTWQAQIHQTVARHHAPARQAGVRFPEVNWPAVVRDVLGEGGPSADLEKTERWAVQVMSCSREIEPMPGAVEVLPACRHCQWQAGIASNAQAYTLDEVTRTLGQGGASLRDMAPDLMLWSYDLGFSKPSPEIFQILSQRAELRGIHRSEILMIGDREDNDLAPARAAGWQAWAVCAERGLWPLLEAMEKVS